MSRTDQASEPSRHVVCRRLNAERSSEEHLACAYCFGKAADVAAGDKARFCDYQPGVDPICFGFPEGSERIERG
jgi:hypothetical protein